MSFIKLISTDFDGTLIGFGSDGRCSVSFAQALQAHRERGGLWAVNTGRNLDYAIEGVARFEAPVEPDFLLTNEREVYRNDGEWVPYGDWNQRCRERHEQLFAETAHLFADFELLAKKRGGITMIYEEQRAVGLVTQTEELMHELIDELDQAVSSHPDFSYQRNTIYLRFCHRDYHKGSALGELCRLENIPPGEVFAAGDHFNDLPMLDGKYAAMTACPANAIPQVRECVRLSQGCIAELNWADGVAAALHHYETRP